MPRSQRGVKRTPCAADDEGRAAGYQLRADFNALYNL